MPATDAQIVAHFDITVGQMPENITLEPDESALLTFVGSAQIARVRPDGRTEIVAALPSGGEIGGIVRTPDGTLYVTYQGEAQIGIWCVQSGHDPELFAALPDAKYLNGLALDGKTLYVTDSTVGAVWRVPMDGEPSLWASGEDLTPLEIYGSNGIKVHDSAVWVSNTERGLLLRYPIRDDGSAGPVETVATGVEGIDDFDFAGDDVIAALNRPCEVIAVRPGEAPRTLLTEQDGLSNPTSVAVRGDTFYVASAAYVTQRDPNLLKARLF